MVISSYGFNLRVTLFVGSKLVWKIAFFVNFINLLCVQNSDIYIEDLNFKSNKFSNWILIQQIKNQSIWEAMVRNKISTDSPKHETSNSNI